MFLLLDILSLDINVLVLQDRRQLEASIGFSIITIYRGGAIPSPCLQVDVVT